MQIMNNNTTFKGMRQVSTHLAAVPVRPSVRKNVTCRAQQTPTTPGKTNLDAKVGFCFNHWPDVTLIS